MRNAKQHLPPLAEYVDVKLAQEKLAHFPTIDSFRWFVRNNREHLAATGAMIMVAGRQNFHVKLTEQVVVEVGRIAAIGASR